MDQIISVIAPLAAALAIVGFALPSYIGLIRQKGLAKGLILALVIGGLILAIHVVAIALSYPFGEFTFGDALGYKVFGSVPWTIAVAYTPLVLAMFWLSSKVTKSGLRVVLGGLLLAGANAALDPALAFMGLRSWENGGPFFGLPVLNFVGWFLTGMLTTLILHALWGKEEAVKRSVAYSGFAVLWFWGGVNLGLQQWVPAAVGLSLGVILLVLMIIEKRRDAKAE